MSFRIERTFRIFVALVGICGVFFASVAVPVVAIILLALRFRAWEAVLIGLLIDLMWQPFGGILHSFPFFTALAIVLVWIFEPMRTRFLIQ